MLVLAAVILAALLTGCGAEREVSPIEPVPSSQDVDSPRLGVRGVTPLSFGPGEKGSPSWSPGGERIAFVVDGYISDKSLSSESAKRRTTRDLGAERMAWPASGEELVILGDGSPSGEGEERGDTHPLYVTRGAGDLDVERLTEDALAISSSPGGGTPVAALRSGAHESRISAVEAGEADLEAYPEPIEGRVTEVSVSPGGDRALATVALPPEDSSGPERYEIHAFDLEDGTHEVVTRLEEGREVFGAPQQTSNGIYYVAGRRETGQDQEEIRYSLYRLPEGSSSPEPSSSVGQDFIASSIEASPDGDRLALLGRRDSGSAINLYVLDLSEESLYAATSNENMEIQTGADSLDWSPDGDSVAVVARSSVSEPRVYNGSASSLLEDFYNLYEVPVSNLRERE